MYLWFFWGDLYKSALGAGCIGQSGREGEECAVNYNEILSGGNGVEQWGPSVLRSSPFAHRERTNFFPALSSPPPNFARTPFNSTDTSSSPPSSSSPWLTWRGQFFLIPCRRQCSGPGPHSVFYLNGVTHKSSTLLIIEHVCSQWRDDHRASCGQ